MVVKCECGAELTEDNFLNEISCHECWRSYYQAGEKWIFRGYYRNFDFKKKEQKKGLEKWL